MSWTPNFLTGQVLHLYIANSVYIELCGRPWPLPTMIIRQRRACGHAPKWFSIKLARRHRYYRSSTSIIWYRSSRRYLVHEEDGKAYLWWRAWDSKNREKKQQIRWWSPRSEISKRKTVYHFKVTFYTYIENDIKQCMWLIYDVVLSCRSSYHRLNSTSCKVGWAVCISAGTYEV